MDGGGPTAEAPGSVGNQNGGGDEGGGAAGGPPGGAYDGGGAVGGPPGGANDGGGAWPKPAVPTSSTAIAAIATLTNLMRELSRTDPIPIEVRGITVRGERGQPGLDGSD